MTHTISEFDRTHIYEILRGHGDWYGALLIRLFEKADSENRVRLAFVYPDYAQAFYDWDRKTGPYKGRHDVGEFL